MDDELLETIGEESFVEGRRRGRCRVSAAFGTRRVQRPGAGVGRQRRQRQSLQLLLYLVDQLLVAAQGRQGPFAAAVGRWYRGRRRGRRYR
ncbi:ORFL121C [Human betaherpesvirus 5]|nr:ORFL121C [Human betaherpesvirus 5]QHX40442.1 ORFL121C [Human betaherpesvirus 5]